MGFGKEKLFGSGNFKGIPSYPGGIKNSPKSLEVPGVWNFGIFLSLTIPEVFFPSSFPKNLEQFQLGKTTRFCPRHCWNLGKISSFFLGELSRKIQTTKQRAKTKEFNLGEKKTGEKTWEFCAEGKAGISSQTSGIGISSQDLGILALGISLRLEKNGINRKTPDFFFFFPPILKCVGRAVVAGRDIPGNPGIPPSQKMGISPQGIPAGNPNP